MKHPQRKRLTATCLRERGYLTRDALFAKLMEHGLFLGKAPQLLLERYQKRGLIPLAEYVGVSPRQRHVAFYPPATLTALLRLRGKGAQRKTARQIQQEVSEQTVLGFAQAYFERQPPSSQELFAVAAARRWLVPELFEDSARRGIHVPPSLTIESVPVYVQRKGSKWAFVLTKRRRIPIPEALILGEVLRQVPVEKMLREGVGSKPDPQAEEAQRWSSAPVWLAWRALLGFEEVGRHFLTGNLDEAARLTFHSATAARLIRELLQNIFRSGGEIPGAVGDPGATSHERTP